MIAKEIAEILKVLNDGANNFGELKATAIWALFTTVLGLIIAYDKHEAHKKDVAWQKIRTDDAVSDSKMAEALHMLAEDNQKRTAKLTELTLIIDERLPRR